MQTSRNLARGRHRPRSSFPRPRQPMGEAWAFEDIHLELSAPPVRRRVVIRIEPDLLGFVVEQRPLLRLRGSGMTRRCYAPDLATAITAAGQMAHDRMSQGYVLVPPSR